MDKDIVIGIISYFPDDIRKKQERISRFERLLGDIDRLMPQIPLFVIAQNWRGYSLPAFVMPKATIYTYPKLGIIGARDKLREKFLSSAYNSLIMFDDDAIISESPANLVSLYIETIRRHRNGFAFIKDPQRVGNINPYWGSQLNFCSISRYIYEREPIPHLSAENNEGYEDRVFSTLLHYKYKDLEFDAPEGVHCSHFKNPEIWKYGGNVPSTWNANGNWDRAKMWENTCALDRYIVTNGDLPENIGDFLRGE